MPDFGGFGAFPSIKQWQTLVIFKDGRTITSLILNIDETLVDGDTSRYWVNADGNDDHWEEAYRGLPKTLTYTGDQLRVRGQLIGYGGANTYVENLRVTVTTA